MSAIYLKNENGKTGQNHKIVNILARRPKRKKQAGTELGQAQLQLELGFTLIKVCCHPKSHTSYQLNFHQLYLKSIIYDILARVGWVSSMQCHSILPPATKNQQAEYPLAPY